MDTYEIARLQAVEQAVRKVRAEPGRITKSEIDAALAAKPNLPDPVPGVVEETV